MCTVTILPGAALLSPPQPRPLLRLVFTRDELRSRRSARAPEERVIEGRRVLMPIDADAGGTWVAATDAGLVFGLLNLTADVALKAPVAAREASPPPGGEQQAFSRGTIIPALAGCERLGDVVARLRSGGASRTGPPMGEALDLARFQPFRLLAVNPDTTVEAVWDGRRLRVEHQPLVAPRLRTSSSLGDTVVRRPRTALFRRRLARPPFDPGEQDAFHRHQWPDRPHLSVLMSRADAQSVSITTIEVDDGRVTMTYEPLDGSGSTRSVLALRPAGGVQSRA